MTPGVSVIVCCYNSAERIGLTMRYLSKQVISEHVPWEVIFVDNASKDDTSQTISQLLQTMSFSCDVILTHESNPGLSHARLKGIKNSKYSYVLFCDDDNGLDPTYVATAWEIMSNHPDIGALGGCGRFAGELPKWLTGLQEYYALGSQGASGDVTDTRGCLYGAGLVVRKKALLELENKNFEALLSDRKGKSLVSGGDTELTYAIRMLGYRLWYDERLKFVHFIPKSRLNKRYFVKLIFYIGYSWMGLLPYHRFLNRGKQKHKSPDWIDLLYVIKNIGISFMRSLHNLLKFNFIETRRTMLLLPFHFGEMFFIIKHFGCYKSDPGFFYSLKTKKSTA